jgi:integrase
MGALKYLANYKSLDTKKSYSLGVKKFLRSVYNVEILNGDLEALADRYLTEKRDRQQDVQNFVNGMDGSPPMTIKLFITAVKIYMEENGVEIPVRFWKVLRRQRAKGRAWTMDKVPSNAELKKMVMEMPIQGKALYLTLASSGMRIGEAEQLRIGDVELEKDPAQINIRGAYTKTNTSRIAFISTEAKECLKDWLKRREGYIKTAASKSKHAEKSMQDDRLFPFTETNAYVMLQNALDKIGMNGKDPTTLRNLYHPHALRKFFRTRMGSVIPVDVTEALMGHEGYLTEVYRRYSVEDLAEFYKKGEHSLTVFGNGAEVSKLKVEIEEKSKTLNEGMATLALKNAELENRLTALIASNEEEKKAWDLKLKEIEENQKRMGELIRKAVELEIGRRKA